MANFPMHPALCFLFTILLAIARGGDARAASPALMQPAGETFHQFLRRITIAGDSSTRRLAVHRYLDSLRTRGGPPIEDSTVFFLFSGMAGHVSVAGDMNSWKPLTDTMTRVEGTDLWFMARTFPRSARIEYKLVVDSIWSLDPLNSRLAAGAFGANSEIRMPDYASKTDTALADPAGRGTLDTLIIESRMLGNTHPVFVYLPPGYSSGGKAFPLLLVMDGGDYLKFGMMKNILDNLIAQHRIRPVVAAFVDPRTGLHDGSTNLRMSEYALNDAFIRFLTAELRPRLSSRYRVSRKTTGIMGASLGGLIATYAAFRQPDIFRFCAAQSPAYWWNDHEIIRLFREESRRSIRLYIDTGTLSDARDESREMKEVLKTKRYQFRYAEFPEGHNWSAWRARIADVLTYFFARQ